MLAGARISSCSAVRGQLEHLLRLWFLTTAPPPGPLPTLCSPAAGAAPAAAAITILHLNDNHARFEPQTASLGPCPDPAVCFGGFARIATLVAEQRQAAAAAGRDVLLLHAGTCSLACALGVHCAIGRGGTAAAWDKTWATMGCAAAICAAHRYAACTSSLGPRLVHLASRACPVNPCIYVCLLPAGDQFTGTIYDYIYTRQGQQVAPPFLNALAVDAVTLGNHEVHFTLPFFYRLPAGI